MRPVARTLNEGLPGPLTAQLKPGARWRPRPGCHGPSARFGNRLATVLLRVRGRVRNQLRIGQRICDRCGNAISAGHGSFGKPRRNPDNLLTLRLPACWDVGHRAGVGSEGAEQHRGGAR